jgi:nitronate monooxygenase
MGTRFTATKESLWDDAMKSRVLTSGGDQTAQTRVFDIVRGAPWPAQYPGRALKNDFYQRWHGNEEQLQAGRTEAEKSYLATKPDDFSARVIWAGEGVDLVKDLLPAAELIERVVAEAALVLRRSADLVR